MFMSLARWSILLTGVLVIGVGAASGDTTAKSVILKTDSRLDKKITYEARALRVYQVTDDLSRLSGVTIHSGVDQGDWRYRDLPITIYCKDLELGKLLNAIATSTHGVVRPFKSKSGAMTYRLRASPVSERAYRDEKAANDHWLGQLQAWNWDAATLLKDLPDSEVDKQRLREGLGHDELDMARAAASLMAALGPVSKNRVLSGESVTLSPQTAPPELKGLVTEYLKAVDRGLMNLPRRAMANAVPAVRDSYAYASEDELNQGSVTIAGGGFGVSYRHGKVTRGDVLDTGFGGMSWSPPSVSRIAEYVPADVQQKKLPPLPKFVAPPKVVDHPAEFTDMDWKWDVLSTTIKVDKPKDKPELIYADAAVEIAKAAGVNFVAEDFRSLTKDRGVEGAFGKEMTFKEALQAADPDFTWLVDKNSKLLSCYYWYWHERHESLVPERITDGLIAKANSDGVELEDLLQLAPLRRPYLVIPADKDLVGLPWGFLTPAGSADLWGLYAGLDDEFKSIARSEPGLPLSAIESTLTPDALREWMKSDPLSLQRLGLSPDAMLKLSDPAVCSTFVLKVICRDDPVRSGSAMKRHSYLLQVTGSVDGQPIKIEKSGPSGLPFYSQRREAEIAKAAK